MAAPSLWHSSQITSMVIPSEARNLLFKTLVIEGLPLLSHSVNK